MIDKQQLGVGFKKIVPLELPAGTVYLRTLTVAEDIGIKSTGNNYREHYLQRVALQVCDADGTSFLTLDDVKAMDLDHFSIIVEAIDELSESIRKKA